MAEPFPLITGTDLQRWLDDQALCFATDKRPDGADVKLVFTLSDRAWKLRVCGEPEEIIGHTENAAARFNQATGRIAVWTKLREALDAAEKDGLDVDAYVAEFLAGLALSKDGRTQEDK